MIGSINFVEKNKKLTTKQKIRIEELTLKKKSKKITEKELITLKYLKNITKQKTIQTVLRDQKKIVSKQNFLKSNESEIPLGIFYKLIKDVRKYVLRSKKIPQNTKNKKLIILKNDIENIIKDKLKTITDAIEKTEVLQKIQVNSENLNELDLTEYIINGKTVTKDFFNAYPLSFILPPKIYFYLNISFLLTFCEITINKQLFETESENYYQDFLKDEKNVNLYIDEFGNQVAFSSQALKKK